MKRNLKKEFLNLTFDILQTEGVSGVSIRRLAKEAGCTSTAIYNHFDNLEHLICVASVQLLDRYLIDFKKCTAEIHNALELNLALWNKIARYALENPDVFELLFFGQYKNNLVDIFYEYYEVFPEKFQEMDGFIVSVVFNGNLFERDVMLYKRAANQGYLPTEIIPSLAKMDVYMLHGWLLEFKGKKLTPDEIEQEASAFMNIIRSILQKYRKDI